MSRWRHWPVALLAGGLAACTVGPRFTAPDEPVPAQYAGVAAAKDAPAAETSTAGAPAAGTAGTGSPTAATPGAARAAAPTPPRATDQGTDSFWWRQFHDPELDRLEEQVVAGNLDLKAAYLRIVEARIEVQAARAQGLPSLSASAAYTREQLGLAGILKQQGVAEGPGSPAAEQGLISSLEKPVNLYQIGFDATWELDLFGKVRRSVEAAGAQGDEAVESRNDLLVSLEAEVAQTYFQLRSAQQLRDITRSLIADQRDTLELTRSRARHGLAGEVDVQAAAAQLSTLEAELPPYEQTIGTSRHALAVLSGQNPAALDDRFGDSSDPPALPPVVPVGVPSTLARRRPDVRNAEAALHAATAQIGVAVASLYPDVSLTGTFGLRNLGTRYLFDWASRFYTFGPSISLPIFQGGALVANVRLSHAEAAAAAVNYRKTVLGALQEVEDGLTNLEWDQQRSTALKASIDADRRALDIDLDAYRHGIVTYITVLTAQMQMVQARQQYAQALLTQSTDLVKLYKALGGGWEGAPGLAQAASPPQGSP